MSELSNTYGFRCVPGVQPAQVREVLGGSASQVGVRAFEYGTELRATEDALHSALHRLSREGLYTGLHCTADGYARSVFERLVHVGATIVTAESCTAGMVAASLTEVPGSSAILWGGYVVYSNEAKVRLGVSPAVLESSGAVSARTAEDLVRASLAQSEAAIAVSVSGIAGPDGGTQQKPVGTVWVAAGARTGGVRSRRCLFHGTRQEVRSVSVGACHGMLLQQASELTRGY